MSEQRQYPALEIFKHIDHSIKFNFKRIIIEIDELIHYHALYNEKHKNMDFDYEFNKIFYVLASFLDDKIVSPSNAGVFNFDDFSTDKESILLVISLFFGKRTELNLEHYNYGMHDDIDIMNRLESIFYAYDNGLYLSEKPLLLLSKVVPDDYLKLESVMKEMTDKNLVIPPKHSSNQSNFIALEFDFEEKLKRAINHLSVRMTLFKEKLEANVLVSNTFKRLDQYATIRETIMDHYENPVNEETLSRIHQNQQSLSRVKVASNFPLLKRSLKEEFLHLFFDLPLRRVEAETIEKVGRLLVTYPHFKEVISFILINLKSNLHYNKSIYKCKPILLVGTNGIGKSNFIYELSEILGFHSNFINMGSISSTFELSGLDSGWANGHPGFFSSSLIKNNVANPLLILDEIDKTSTSYTNGRPTTPLYDVLEKRSSEKFFENYFSTSFNFNYISFMATCNTIETIERGILNRFEVFNISSPTVDMLDNIVKSVYISLKKDPIFQSVVINKEGIRSLINAFKHNRITNIRKISRSVEKIMMEALSNNIGSARIVIDYLDDQYLEPSKDTTIH